MTFFGIGKFYFLLLFLLLISIFDNIVLVSSVQHSDLTILYIAQCSPWPFFTITVLCNVIDYIPYSVLFISVTCLFYNWKFILLITFTFFIHLFTLLPASNQQFVLYIWVCFFVLFCFLDSTYKWNDVVIVFLCLIYRHNILQVHPCYCEGQDLILL